MRVVYAGRMVDATVDGGVVMYLKVPEAKGRTLEEIEQQFE
jgi:hypothetical protein